MSRFSDVFPGWKPVIGVIHLPPLPGYPGSPGLAGIVDKALRDLAALEHGGADGALIENEEDRPHRVEAGRETIAVMTRVARELVTASRTAIVGVEILLNDPRASLAVAMASGARFIRTDYFVDRMTRPEYGGEMAVDPAGLVAYRRQIGAEHVLILADIQVKHATMIEPRPLAESARVAEAHAADAVVVSGALTGDAPAVGDVLEARRGVSDCPLVIGSGLDADNVATLLGAADAALVGTSIKHGSMIDETKVRALVGSARRIASGRP